MRHCQGNSRRLLPRPVLALVLLQFLLQLLNDLQSVLLGRERLEWLVGPVELLLHERKKTILELSLDQLALLLLRELGWSENKMIEGHVSVVPFLLSRRWLPALVKKEAITFSLPSSQTWAHVANGWGRFRRSGWSKRRTASRSNENAFVNSFWHVFESSSP